LTRLIAIALLFFPLEIFPAPQEYDFSLSEIQKKPFQIGGYAEFLPVLFHLNVGSPLYRLQYYDQNWPSQKGQTDIAALLNVSWEKGSFSARLRLNTRFQYADHDWDGRLQIYEGSLSWNPSPHFHLEAGKQRLKWGKGYAWNPVAFVDRLKNPNDPGLALEGFTVVRAEYLKSFTGKLQALTLTGILIPVTAELNSGFGTRPGLNVAGKIYCLYADTDIDLMFLAGPGVSGKVGMDFSRNLGSNLEIHGETGYFFRETRTLLDGDGNLREETTRGAAWLLGLRYLSRINTTVIAEVVHQPAGLQKKELDTYYRLIDQAYQVFSLNGVDQDLRFLSGHPGAPYRQFGSMKNYLYLRAVQKEPFNIVYFNPAFTAIVNLVDGCFLTTVELLYQPVTNLEVRGRLVCLRGVSFSEFGGKANDHRWELRLRFYF